MRPIALLFLVFGIGLTVLYFMEVELELLRWVDNWGEEVAWAIRGGSIVLGGLLFMLGKPKPQKR